MRRDVRAGARAQGGPRLHSPGDAVLGSLGRHRAMVPRRRASVVVRRATLSATASREASPRLAREELNAAHRTLTGPGHGLRQIDMSPLKTLPLGVAVGVAGAAAVVVFQSVVADAVGGALAIVALIAVTWSAIRLAGDIGAPHDEST